MFSHPLRVPDLCSRGCADRIVASSSHPHAASFFRSWKALYAAATTPRLR